MKKGGPFFLQDVLDTGYSLEPLTCRFCGNRANNYDPGIHDSLCEHCGKFQSEKKK